MVMFVVVTVAYDEKLAPSLNAEELKDVEGLLKTMGLCTSTMELVIRKCARALISVLFEFSKVL